MSKVLAYPLRNRYTSGHAAGMQTYTQGKRACPVMTEVVVLPLGRMSSSTPGFASSLQLRAGACVQDQMRAHLMAGEVYVLAHGKSRGDVKGRVGGSAGKERSRG